MRTRVRDVMTDRCSSRSRPDDTLLDRGPPACASTTCAALPVVEDGDVPRPRHEQALAARYLDDLDGRRLRGPAGRRSSRLVDALDGELLAGDASTRRCRATCSSARWSRRRWSRDIAARRHAHRRRPAPHAADGARGRRRVPHRDRRVRARRRACSSSRASRAARSSSTATGHLRGRAPGRTSSHTRVRAHGDRRRSSSSPDTLLSEAAEDLFASPQREALVVDDDGRLVGHPHAHQRRARAAPPRHARRPQRDRRSRPTASRRRPSSRSSTTTASATSRPPRPITFLEPAGRLDGDDRRDALPRARGRPAAARSPGCMLSAVLTDTVLLKSPTTTDIDREIVEWLAGDARASTRSSSGWRCSARAASSGRVLRARRAVRADLKEYRVGDERRRPSRRSRPSTLDEVLAHRDEIVGDMERWRSDARLRPVRAHGDRRRARGQRAARRRQARGSPSGRSASPFAGGSAWFAGRCCRARSRSRRGCSRERGRARERRRGRVARGSRKLARKALRHLQAERSVRDTAGPDHRAVAGRLHRHRRGPCSRLAGVRPGLGGGRRAASGGVAGARVHPVARHAAGRRPGDDGARGTGVGAPARLGTHPSTAWLLALLMLAGPALGDALKDVFARSRPPAALALIAEPGSSSFPSGHALASLLFYGALALFVVLSDVGAAAEGRSRSWRRPRGLSSPWASRACTSGCTGRPTCSARGSSASRCCRSLDRSSRSCGRSDRPSGIPRRREDSRDCCGR